MLRLRELRLELDKTQEEIAKIIGISRQVYANWENEINQPSLEMLCKMSEFFQCSIDYLIGHSDDFGNVTVYQQTDGVHSLSADEQKIIDTLRRNAPNCPVEWNTLYAELPDYMQATIFAELKGMHLGYVTSKAKAKKAN